MRGEICKFNKGNFLKFVFVESRFLKLLNQIRIKLNFRKKHLKSKLLNKSSEIQFQYMKALTKI